MDTDKLLAPREAATSEEESQAGDHPPSEYESDGTDSEVPSKDNRANCSLGANAEPGHAGDVESDAGEDRGTATEGHKEEEDLELKAGQSEGFSRGRGLRGGGRRAAPTEPYEVPRSGPFYMHDDRFEEAAPDAQQRAGEKKKKSGIDGAKWRHDKFEELEKQFEEGRPVIRGRRRGSGGRTENRHRRGSGRLDRHHSSEVKTPDQDGKSNGEDIAEGIGDLALREDDPRMKSQRGQGRSRSRGGRGYSKRSQS